MCKRLLIVLAGLVLAAQSAQADIIHLKNGSILKGKVASFSDDQFMVMLDTGSGRYLSRAMVYVGDVARIEFEGAPASAADLSSDSPRDRASDRPADTRDNPARVSISPDIPRTSPPAEQPRDTAPTDPQPVRPSDTAQPQPDKPAPDRPAATDKPAAATTDTAPPDMDRPAGRKSAGMVRSATIDVIGKRDWTSTGMIVKRGDHIRINATGAVTLDPVTGRTSGPEGTSDLADPKKLMAEQPTGALIGVIGADNDDFIFIGKSAEFTATRDGLLFLSVNEGNLSDNVGSFKAVIEVQAPKK